MSDYYVLVETKQNKTLMSCPRTDNWRVWCSSYSYTMWLNSVISLQSRMLGLFVETKCPWMTGDSMWSDSFRNHQVQNIAPTSSKPCTLLPVSLLSTSWSLWTVVSFCLVIPPPRSICFSNWPTSHPSWRPKMKPCGLSSVCIFSISGNRGSI